MPKFVNNLSADERYNLMLGLIGYLTKNPNCEVSELEQVFKVTNQQIKEALHTMNKGGHFIPGGIDEYPFWIDIDALDEEDFVVFTTAAPESGAPKISQAQAAALATGLMYLQTLPQFANDQDIEELQRILSSLEPEATTPVIDIKPGTLSESTNLVIEAINAKRRIRMDYVNRSGETGTREIDPVKLIESDGNLAVLSWCLKNEEQRNFRIDRMSKIELLPGTISSQADEMFENLDELSDNAYNPGQLDHDVKVQVTPEGYSLVSQFEVIEEPKKGEDGTLEVIIKVGKLEHLGKLIAKYGGAAKVLEPEVARQIVRDYALVALGREPLEPNNMSVE